MKGFFGVVMYPPCDTDAIEADFGLLKRGLYTSPQFQLPAIQHSSSRYLETSSPELPDFIYLDTTISVCGVTPTPIS